MIENRRIASSLMKKTVDDSEDEVSRERETMIDKSQDKIPSLTGRAAP